jgi:hypothetical protein
MDTEVRKRQVSLDGAEKDTSLAKVPRTEAGGLPLADDGWEVWLKVLDNASSLGRQAQNQILGGMSLNVTNVMEEFEVERRSDSWGRWATSRGLEVMRTHLNQTRDELDHAARRILVIRSSWGGGESPQTS